MSEFDYKPNSYRSKEEQQNKPAEKRASKVVDGSIKKKNEMRKFADVFFSEDIHNVKTYIMRDVIIPSIKKVISETVDMFLYGDGRHRDSDIRGTKTSYGRFYEQRGDVDRRNDVASNGMGFEDVTVNTRGDAEKVMRSLAHIMKDYGMVRVADLYEVAGVTGAWTANDFGWMSIDNFQLIRLRDGRWWIKTPRPMPIK